MLTENSIFRYVVCKDLLPGHEAVHEYLFAVNEELIKLHVRHEETPKDILEVYGGISDRT